MLRVLILTALMCGSPAAASDVEFFSDEKRAGVAWVDQFGRRAEFGCINTPAKTPYMMLTVPDRAFLDAVNAYGESYEEYFPLAYATPNSVPVELSLSVRNGPQTRLGLTVRATETRSFYTAGLETKFGAAVRWQGKLKIGNSLSEKDDLKMLSLVGYLPGNKSFSAVEIRSGHNSLLEVVQVIEEVIAGC